MPTPLPAEKSAAIITDLLWHHWPHECEIAGPDNVATVALRDVTFTPAKSGDFLDFGSTFSTLVQAATLISTALKMYFLLRDRLGRPPNTQELRTSTEAELPSSEPIPLEIRFNLYRTLPDRLASSSDS